MSSVFRKFQRKDSSKYRSPINLGAVWHIATYTVLILFAVIVGFPLFFVASLSLQSLKEVAQFPPTIVPHSLRFTNYVTLFTEYGPFPRYILNSFIFAGTLTISHMFLSSLAGYILAKFDFPFKHVIVVFVLSSMLFPANLRAIPLYTLVVKLGWVGSYAGLITPFLTGGFTIFLMRQYIVSIPTELIEAARVDGSSELGIFVRIIFPLAKPALMVLAIFQFTLRWNMLLWPLLVARGDLMTLPVVIAQLKGSIEEMTYWNLIGAGSMILLLPTFALFLLLQRHIVKGTMGAVKF